MKFGSKFTAYQELLRAAEPILHPRTGTTIGHERQLMAEFAKHEGEAFVLDPASGDPMTDPYTGRPLGRVANIHGGFWDSEEWQAETGATDEERKLLEDALLRQCRIKPDTVWLIETPKAGRPWPTYDETPREKIVETAIMLGLVGETITYESQNANRSTVIGPLEKHVAKQEEDARAEDALTAA